MINNKVSLDLVVGNRLYQLICLPDSPMEEVIDVLQLMEKQVRRKIFEQEEKLKGLSTEFQPEIEKEA